MADNEERVSLREDLGAAFDDAFGSEDDGEEVADDDSVVEDQEEDATEDGEPTAEDAVQDTEGDTEPEPEDGSEDGEDDQEEGDEPEDPDEPDEIEPLKHWHKEDREVFKTLPKDAQEFLLRRDKEFQASATKKQMEVSDIKRAFDPVRDELVKSGVSEADAIRRLIGAHVSLMEKPKESIMYLMQQYGINPSDILGTVEGGSESTDDVAMKEIQDLKRRLKEYEERTEQERISEVGSQIAEFEKSNEFFKQVEPEMAALARSHAQAGKPMPTLEKLYEDACWMNESVRKELLDRREKEEVKSKAKRGEENISKAKRAAKARVQPSRKTSGTSTKEVKKSLHDDLSEVFDKVTQAR